MVSVIKEICIFIIVAQAILFFVPGKSYIKYVRILVGIIMILRITEPIFGLVMDEESQQKIRDRIRMLEENIDISDVEEKTKSSGAKIIVKVIMKLYRSNFRKKFIWEKRIVEKKILSLLYPKKMLIRKEKSGWKGLWWVNRS